MLKCSARKDQHKFAFMLALLVTGNSSSRNSDDGQLAGFIVRSMNLHEVCFSAVGDLSVILNLPAQICAAQHKIKSYWFTADWIYVVHPSRRETCLVLAPNHNSEKRQPG